MFFISLVLAVRRKSFMKVSVGVSLTLEIFFSCVSYILSNPRITVIIDKFARIGEHGCGLVRCTVVTSS